MTDGANVPSAEDRDKSAVWNTLHDGGIESLHGSVPGDVTVSVGIAYLCDLLPTKAEYVVVRLVGCTRLEYAPWDGVAITALAELLEHDIELLSATLENGVVCITCAGGKMKLQYDAVRVSLAEGTPVSQQELEDTARRYWTEWSERNKQT